MRRLYQGISNFPRVVSRDRWCVHWPRVYTLHGGEFSFVWLERGVFATRNPIVITSGSPRPSRERRENGNSLSLPWHRTSTRALLSHVFSLSASSPPRVPTYPSVSSFVRPVRTRAARSSTHTRADGSFHELFRVDKRETPAPSIVWRRLS